MTENVWLRYIHKDSVALLQVVGRAEVALYGQGLLRRMAEPHPASHHQGCGGGLFGLFFEHQVFKRGSGGALSKNKFHSGVNLEESSLIDLQGPVLKSVNHSS